MLRGHHTPCTRCWAIGREIPPRPTGQKSPNHLTRANLTFRYTPTGPEGLIKGKQVYLAVASGGIYSEGPQQAADFAVPYLRWMLGFLGMTDVTVARAGGVKLPEFQATALQMGIDSVAVSGRTVAWRARVRPADSPSRCSLLKSASAGTIYVEAGDTKLLVTPSNPSYTFGKSSIKQLKKGFFWIFATIVQ